jgi:hypothetical protein
LSGRLEGVSEPGTTSARGDAFDAALIVELARKTSVSWLRYAGGVHPAWHLWHDDALYVLSGGEEQCLPGIEEAEEIAVTMRSKENGGRLITWVGSASRLLPEEPRWPEVTAAMVSDRLNLESLTEAPLRGARESVVTRIRPTGESRESPGDLSHDAHLGVPAATPATTRGVLPRVLHRRVKRRPPLS